MEKGARIENYKDLAGLFPGIEDKDPEAMRKLAIYAANAEDTSVFDWEHYGDYPGWYDEVGATWSAVRDWKNESNRQPLVDFAQSICDRYILKRQENEFFKNLEGINATEGHAMVLAKIAEYSLMLTVQLAGSPLFPEGRELRRPIDSYCDEDNRYFFPGKSFISQANGQAADPRYQEYLEDTYQYLVQKEALGTAADILGKIDNASLLELTKQFGAKAAHLMLLEEKLKTYQDFKAPYFDAVDIKIPPFLVVGVDMHESWRSSTADYEQKLEEVREGVISLVRPDVTSGNLMVVRSSAVFSEDGDNHTGAGIYASVAVDPHDKNAFEEAVRSVYESVNSPLAVSYRQSIGIGDEQMGLVIQAYVESTERGLYGQANSRTVNESLLEVSSNFGILYYDKHQLRDNFLLDKRRHGADFLHSQPDHTSKIYRHTSALADIAQAAMLAEVLFDRPIQLEFVGDYIVQARTMDVKAPEQEVVFPVNKLPIVECRGAGYGEYILNYLDGDDNSNEEGYVVFGMENGFSERSSFNAFPLRGAVIIMEPSRNGHIQALCQEKGLLCVSPWAGQDISKVLDPLLFGSEEHDGRRWIKHSNNVTLHFVSDGYTARVYTV